MENRTHTNALIHESSPYLLQHAHNPVQWYPWGAKALDKARNEDKLIIVSIGYSSCHWCHVMERESFEDAEVAQVMNEHFVSIKVDREERPDLDHLFMTAVQMLNLQGGWPLNCIALPDGRPIWGGTYFPKAKWIEALREIERYYRSHKTETISYAAELEQGIRQHSLFPDRSDRTVMRKEALQQLVEKWAANFDLQNGGLRGAPKFPMPVHLEFLLHYGVQFGSSRILEHVDRTLTRMARGGIYDQAGGGFARYSVDAQWRIPHFEKMLYDNAQLIGLYSSAFKVFGREHFREVVHQSVEWLKREMTSPEGMFYAALDADSDGKEGSFYVWREDELKDLIAEKTDLFTAYYNISEGSEWENGTHILYRSMEPVEFAEQNGIDAGSFRNLVDRWNRVLLEARSTRIPPGTDDKSLTAWSSLMVSGLIKAYHAFGEREYLDLAVHSATQIRNRCLTGGVHLYRSYKSGSASIPGFHIDYSLYIEACIDLYSATMETGWLDLAMNLTSVSFEKFFDERSGMFSFNSSQLEVPVSSHAEVQDNVLPSSNSVMGHNLYRLGHLTGKTEYLQQAVMMLGQLQDRFEQHPFSHSNWGRLILMHIFPYYEVAITGADAFELLQQLMKDYQPNMVVAGTNIPSDLPLFRNRFNKHKSLIFVCEDQECQLPFTHLKDAKKVYHIG
jgi:uncharacterized protein YyaL (SSP411 family)